MAILRFAGATSFILTPSNSTSPAVGVSSPAMIRSVVVLPQPLGPSSVTNSPERMVSDRSSMTTLPGENALRRWASATSAIRARQACSSSSLSFDAAGSEAARQVLLQEGEEDDDGRAHHHGGGHQRRPFDVEA